MGAGSWVKRPGLKVGKGHFAGFRGKTEEIELKEDKWDRGRKGDNDRCGVLLRTTKQTKPVSDLRKSSSYSRANTGSF